MAPFDWSEKPVESDLCIRHQRKCEETLAELRQRPLSPNVSEARAEGYKQFKFLQPYLTEVDQAMVLAVLSGEGIRATAIRFKRPNWHVSSAVERARAAAEALDQGVDPAPIIRDMYSSYYKRKKEERRQK